MPHASGGKISINSMKYSLSKTQSSLCEIKFVDDDQVVLAVDGQISEYLDPDSKVTIKKSPFDIKMITFKDSNYFQTLRLKMGWGKRG